MWVFQLSIVFGCVYATNSKNIPKSLTKVEFLAERQNALISEHSEAIGGDIRLTAKEQYVDKLFLEQKLSDFTDGRLGKRPFLPSLHFFEARPLIDESTIYQMIKEMPKGAVLHIHDSGMVSLDWVLKNVTYRENCYICDPRNKTTRVLFKFADRLPNATDQCQWQLLSDRRETEADVDKFDNWLKGQMSLLRDDLANLNPSQDDLWKAFTSCFRVMDGLVFHAPVFRDYYRQALTEFLEDNVQYMEIRILLQETYNLDGSTNDFLWLLEAYKNVTDEFVRDNPSSSGAKLIITGIRAFNNDIIKKIIDDTIEFRKRFPDFVVGFDLVSQEDRGQPLLYYLDTLLAPNAEDPSSLPYIFHAGETDWQGLEVDENIIDAILLGTKRIGHGYALSKHPWALEQVKNNGIAIEVNPISNQVLGLVKDLRNHPATGLMSQNYPIVISCDDPPMWGAKGVSYDFYAAFMGMTGANTGLAFLKKIARNSLEYSCLSSTEKQAAIRTWEEKWDLFVDGIVANVTINETEVTTIRTKPVPAIPKPTGGSGTSFVHHALVFGTIFLSLML